MRCKCECIMTSHSRFRCSFGFMDQTISRTKNVSYLSSTCTRSLSRAFTRLHFTAYLLHLNRILANMNSSKSKSNKIATSPNKRSVVNNVATSKKYQKEELRDQYLVPSDYIWRDCILHERNSIEMWRKTWDCFEIPSIPKPKKISPFSLVPTDSKDILYKKSSDMIGNYLKRPSFPFGEDIINGKTYHAPPKIRFTQEQYGYYRMKKYLANNTSFTEHSKYPISRYVRHEVYPLLC